MSNSELDRAVQDFEDFVNGLSCELQTSWGLIKTSLGVSHNKASDDVAIIERTLMQFHIPAIEVSQAAGCIVRQLRTVR